jgi:hypothetical protein
VVPALGTLETVFGLLKPRIEAETERMRNTAQQMDRLFQLDDQLTELLEFADFIEATTKFADRALASARLAFESDAAWLVGVLAAAERS